MIRVGALSVRRLGRSPQHVLSRTCEVSTVHLGLGDSLTDMPQLAQWPCISGGPLGLQPCTSRPSSSSTKKSRTNYLPHVDDPLSIRLEGSDDGLFLPFLKQPVSSVVRQNSEGAIDRESDEIAEDLREAYEVTEVDLEDIADHDDYQDHNATRRQPRSKQHTDINLFGVRENPRKIDLSYTNVLRWEGNLLDKTPTTPASTFFRSDSRTRSVLVSYMRDVQPLLDQDETPHQQALLSKAIQKTFDNTAVERLAEASFDARDVACWSWILSASSIDVAINRYAALHKDFRESGEGRRISKLVILQLLRAGSVSPLGLRQLCDTLRAELLTYRGFSWVTRVCLVVRLLRHARRVSPEQIPDIVFIIGHIFSKHYKGRDVGEHELRRLTHVFNRFLTLLSLAPRRNAFNSYLLQQNAQLALIRMMLSFQPSLPVTREGFRALIKVQLLHKKTPEERAWAGAKSLSWPPWREDKLGIEEDLEYPGQESRTSKLLRRMSEAGYSHSSWEQSASVLAGWDTDKSPTIQTRAVLRRPPFPWLLSPPKKKKEDEGQPEHDLWYARIQATRTRLEAWAAFCAYLKSSKAGSRQRKLYYAMLGKLMTRTVLTDSEEARKHFPGDLLETFEEPPDSNQMVYVERKIPTADEFYEEMLREGIKPAGGMLCDLLDYADSLEAGFRYIQDSALSEVISDMLLHAEKYPRQSLAQMLHNLRPQLWASFMRLLCRFALSEHPVVRLPASAIGPTEYKLQRWESGQLKFCYPITYAEELLRLADKPDTIVWNGFLRGVHDLIAITNMSAKAGNFSQFEIKLRVLRVFTRMFTFSSMQNSTIQPDIDTFRVAANIVELTLRPETYSGKILSVVRSLKIVFAHAICGYDFTQLNSKPPLLVPEVRDLKSLVQAIISANDVPDLISVLKWLNDNMEIFQGGPKTHPLITPAPDEGLPSIEYLSGVHDLLCMIRLFLEGSEGAPPQDPDALWFTTPLLTTREQIDTARQLCEPLGWPSDADVNAFLEKPANQLWVTRVVKAADLVRTYDFTLENAGGKPPGHHDKVIKFSQIGEKGHHNKGNLIKRMRVGKSTKVGKRSGS